MQIQWKVVLLVGLLVASSVTVVAWTASRHIRQEKTAQFTASAEAQLAPVRRLVQAKLDLAKEQLVQFTRRKESGNAIGNLGDFEVVGLHVENAPGAWSTKWTEKRSDRAARWANNRDLVMMRSLKFSDVREGSTQLTWLLNNGKPIFAVLVPVQIDAQSAQGSEALPDGLTQNAAAAPKRAVVVGFFARNPLAAITEDFVGSANTVFVVNQLGYVLSHSNKAYIGTLFTEDDVVKEIIKDPMRDFKAGIYENLDGEKVMARWERVEFTNLYTIIATPLAVIKDASESTQKTMLWFGVVGTFLSMVLTFFASRYLNAASLDARLGGDPTLLMYPTEPAQPVKPEAIAIKPQEPAPVAVARPLETQEAYKKIAQGLHRELRTPLAALLGHVQILAEQSSDPHAQAIEAEARQIRDVLDAIGGVDGEQNLNLRPVEPAEIVQIAYSHLEKEIAVAGIKCNVEADSKVSLIDASAVHLQKAIEAVLRQAVESLRTRPGGEIKVRIASDESGKVQIQVRDTGIGMDRAHAARFFEPFYQVYEGAANPGLGLAMARAIFEKHNADVKVESTPGSGTAVTIAMNPAKEQIKAVELPKIAEVETPSAIAPPPSLFSEPIPDMKPIMEESPVSETVADIPVLPDFKIQIPPGSPPPLSFEEAGATEILRDDSNDKTEVISQISDVERTQLPSFPALTLGGKAPISATDEMPPAPSVPGMQGAAFNTPVDSLSKKPSGKPTIKPQVEENSITNLPPMDLSRTEPAPDGVKELELPKMSDEEMATFGGTNVSVDLGQPQAEAEEPEVFAHANLQPNTATGVSINIGESSGITQMDTGSFRVRIRRPKPKGDS